MSYIMDYFGNLSAPILTEDEALNALHTLNPRFLFVKRLKRDAKMLDLGAGEGGVVNYKEWLTPIRNDLKMYAYSLEKGEYFDKYDGYALGRWPEDKPFDSESFDAIFCSHFIEHINDHNRFIEWCYVHLAHGGQLYLEFPSEFSIDAPTTSELSRNGVDVYTGNFYDDHTHTDLPDMNELCSYAKQAGFFTQEQGIIKIPLVENEIPALNIGKSKYPMQMAYWSKSNWCRYYIFSKH